MMLSRVAENLFWIGRNVERSLNICRLLDATYQVQLGEVVRPTQQGISNQGVLVPVRRILGLAAETGPASDDLMAELEPMIFGRDAEFTVSTLSTIFAAESALSLDSVEKNETSVPGITLACAQQDFPWMSIILRTCR